MEQKPKPQLLSRRRFLQFTGAAATLPLTGGWSLFTTQQKKRFPLQLFFAEQDLDRIRANTRLPIFRAYWDELLMADLAADERFLTRELQLNNQIRHLQRADRILQREAFLYAVTGKDERAELAHLALSRILAFPKWDYFVEAGTKTIGLQRAPETTVAVSKALDWLADRLTADEKEEALRQLGDKGCEPCYRSLYGMRYPDKVVGWGFDPDSSFSADTDLSRWPIILDKTNLKAVPLSGLGIGALVLEGKDQRVGRWLEMARYSLRTFLKLFEPDGSYPEGGSYWDYVARTIIPFLEVLRRRKGEDWFDATNFPGMVEFMLALQMPYQGNPKSTINFGDSGRSLHSHVGFWIASRSRDGLAQYLAVNHSAGHDPLSLVWYDRDLPPETPGKEHYYHHLDLDWMIQRTGFGEDDLVLAMRSGGPANHEHADRNSVILKAFGEYLLVDHRHAPYDRHHPAWLLRTSPAHNTVLVDGKGHQYHDGREGTNASQASARIVREMRRRDFTLWSSDATPAYALVDPDIDSVTRTVLFFPEGLVVVVIDKLIKKNRPSLFQARFHIDNSDGRGSATTSDNGFALIRPSAILDGTVSTTAGVTTKVERLPIPEDQGVFPFVEVATADPSMTPLLVTVLIPHPAQAPAPKVSIAHKGRRWQVHWDGGPALTIFDEGTIPEVSASR